MDARAALFCFDYLDPLSYLVQRELDALGGVAALPEVRRLPMELRAPPTPILDPDGTEWGARWSRAENAAREVHASLTEPPFLPWTRKAHELALHARARGVEEAIHAALFRAVFHEPRDIGRVDVLVALAAGAGLDASEAKAVLDVDRYAAEVARLSGEATRAGAVEPPTLIANGRTLRGFHNRDALRTFLLR